MAALTELDATDVREGGKWRPLQRAKNALIRYAIGAALACGDRMPPRVLLRLGRVIGSLACLLLQRARATALDNVRRVLPDVDARAHVARVFANAGENLGRCLLLRRRSFRALDAVAITGASWTIFREALDEGRGVVFVSAHLGPFELLPAAIRELGVRPAVVVRESYDPGLDSVVDAHRIARDLDVIHRGHPGAAAKIIRALRAGRPVGFLPDLGGRVLSHPSVFLGQKVAFPVGPQRIARRMGCPLLIGALGPTTTEQREPFAIQIERIDVRGTEEEVTHRVADSLTRSIARLSEHWLWMAPLRSLQTQDE